jgi:hypothetical protein
MRASWFLARLVADFKNYVLTPRSHSLNQTGLRDNILYACDISLKLECKAYI